MYGVLLFSSKCLIDVAISLEQTFGPLVRELAFIITSLGFLMVHKQTQSFYLSLKLLLEPRKAHDMCLSWFLGTLFSFPEMGGPIQDRGGALENTHTLAQVSYFPPSAVCSVLK